MKLFKDGTEVELTGLADQLSTIAENSPKVFESGLSIFRKLVSRDENLTKITAEELGEITKIGSYAFSFCTSLKSITIPSSVTYIGSYAFRNCKSLTSITIPSSVTRIGQDAFNSCESLESITIPSGVTYIGPGMFGGCKSLKSITIPSGVTSIDSHAFDGCTSLKSVTIPQSVTSIGSYAFRDCKSLEAIYFQGNDSQWEAISKGSSWDSGMGDYGIVYTSYYD